MNILDLDYFNTCEYLQNTRGGLLPPMASPTEEGIHLQIIDNKLTLFENEIPIFSKDLGESPKGISVSLAGASGISTSVRTISGGQTTTSTIFISSKSEIPSSVLDRVPLPGFMG